MVNSQQGWIGVDLDGTLAHYTGWNGGAIGAPIPAMVERVKLLLDQSDYKVKIFTARVHGSTGEELEKIVQPIVKWCLEHLGQALDITCVKDMRMIELWDDRCVQVEPNTGRFIGTSSIIK